MNDYKKFVPDPSLLAKAAALFTEQDKRNRAELRTLVVKLADDIAEKAVAREWLDEFLYCFDRLPPNSAAALGSVESLLILLSHRVRNEARNLGRIGGIKSGEARSAWQDDPFVNAIEEANRDQTGAETARRIMAKKIPGLPADARPIAAWANKKRKPLKA